jgi:hypothetical protein
LAIRTGASLYQCARIGPASSDDPIERSNDARVVTHGAQLPLLGEGYVQLILRFGERSFVGGNLCFPFLVLGHCIVQFLLRDESRARFGRLLQAGIIQVSCLVQRLGAIQVAFDPANRVFATPYRRIGTLELGIQLRNLKDGEGLSGFHVVSYIHEDLANIARDLGVHVNLLEGTEVSGHTNRVGDGCKLCQRYGDRTRGSLGALFSHGILTLQAQNGDQSKHRYSNQNQRCSLTHVDSHPCRTSSYSN